MDWVRSLVRGAKPWVVAMVLCGGAASLCGAPLSTAGDQVPVRGIVEFDSDGALIRPDHYRKWVFVGASVTPNELNGGKAAFPEFHGVYVNPIAYDHYAAIGQFPDGTVLVKERVSVGSKQASSGSGYFMGQFLGLEAAVKDSVRFADQPGHWGYFSFGKQPHLVAQAKPFPVASCNACHEATAREDWVFTQYYPVLRAARPAK